MTKIACVAVVKNEERHIAEWIAYQYAIGFDTVILLDNLSTDQTREQAQAFQPHYDLKLLTSPDTGATYQTSAYLAAIEKFGAAFDWMAFFDTDEFLVFDDGITLQACLASRAGDAIGVNWAVFGSSGHCDMPEGLVIENYKYRSDAAFGPNKHIKSIIRPARAKAIINGHMFAMDTPYESLSGNPITWQSPGVVAGAPDYRCGKLHHYFTRSRQNWLAKLQRGYPDIERRMSEFDEYDRNEIYDDYAARAAPMVAVTISKLNSGLAFPAVGITLAANLTGQSADECTAPVALSSFAGGRNVHTIFFGSGSTPLPAVNLCGPRATGFNFCGPFMLPPGIGEIPSTFPAASLPPPLKISRIDNVLYLPGQVAIVSPHSADGAPARDCYNIILAESFNSYWDRQNHYSIAHNSTGGHSLKTKIETATPAAGRFLFLDCQHRDHFGHILSDVVSLAWAYEALRLLGLHDLQVLVYDKTSLLLGPLLEAAGIPNDKLVSFGEAVQLEEAFFATKCFLTQGYTSPLAIDTWRRIRDFQGWLGPALPERIYLSRQNIANRRLRGEEQVISMFAARGFAVIEPETLPLNEQIRLAAHARLIAGPSGSNLFLLAFQQKLQKVFILASPNLIHFSELFLSAGHEAQLTYYIGTAASAAVHAEWDIDLQNIESAIDAWLG